jgi:hypothetical protein
MHPVIVHQPISAPQRSFFGSLVKTLLRISLIAGVEIFVGSENVDAFFKVQTLIYASLSIELPLAFLHL